MNKTTTEVQEPAFITNVKILPYEKGEKHSNVVSNYELIPVKDETEDEIIASDYDDQKILGKEFVKLFKARQKDLKLNTNLHL